MSNSMWQTFTAAKTGELNKVRIVHSGYGNEYTFQLKEGKNVLHQSVIKNPAKNHNAIWWTIPTPGVKVTSGKVYTWVLIKKSKTSGKLGMKMKTPYTRGQNNFGKHFDFAFITYVTPAAPAVEKVDQQQKSHNTRQHFMSNSMWQTFTAGATGELTKVRIVHSGYGNEYTFQLKEGKNVLHQSVIKNPAKNHNAIWWTIPTPGVKVTSGKVYTWVLIKKSSTSGKLGMKMKTPYTRGQNNFGKYFDFAFITYVK